MGVDAFNTKYLSAVWSCLVAAPRLKINVDYLSPVVDS